MAEPRIEIAEDADGKRTKSVGYLGVGGEAQCRIVIDNEANKSYYHHDRRLLPFALVDDDETERERRNENEFEPGRGPSPARNVACRVAVDAPIERGTNGDAKAKEE